MKKKLMITVCIILASIVFLFYFGKGSSNTPIEAIEKSRGNHVDDIVLQKDIENGQVVFYLRNINNGQQFVSAEFVKKTLLGWKWVYGGGHSLPNYTGSNQKVTLDESWSYQYFPSTKGSEFGKSPFPMLFGVIKNSDITSVIVQDQRIVREQKAEIVKTNSTLRFWYVFVTEEQGRKFTISARSTDGKEVSVKSINEENNSRSSTKDNKTD
jgi:hypothetical protein